MTTNEIITELVSYDGWDIAQEKHTQLFNNYLTDLNILHRVAVKVFCDVLSCKHGTISEVNAICENIKHEFINVPNEQGEHIKLATATAEAIVYLSKQKV
jgi:hypothetical protein